MYDAREKALRDRQWALNAARNEGKIEGKFEGKIEGEIKLLRTLQLLLGVPASRDEELVGKSLQDLQSLTDQLQSQLRNRVT